MGVHGRGKEHTPGPTPATIAMGFDMLLVLRWEVIEKRRRAVGSIKGGEDGFEVIWSCC